MKLELSRQIFEEFSSMQIRIPSSESRTVNVDGRKEIHNETDSRFLQFCESD
jgi:hypothetical protein